jgi:hypothetical protein
MVLAIPMIMELKLIMQGILFLQRIIPKVEIVDRLKRKFISYGTNSHVNESSFKVMNDFGIKPSTTISKEEKRYSCWCFLFVNEGVKIEAKIVHKGRGKFKILNDEYGGRYINKIVDASDVVRCIVEI